MPLNCDKNILSYPVYAGVIPSTAAILITFADGTSVLTTWATILASITPNEIALKVGGGGSNPAAGDTSYTNISLIGKRVRIFRQGLKQPTTDPGGGYYYSFNNSTGTVTPSPAFAADEFWSIEVY